MTLREICDTYSVSRRAVQGYEKAGLVKPSGKNDRGHLLYDESKQQRIAYIKQWRDLGFTIRETKLLIDAPHELKRDALQKQIRKLKERKTQIDDLIKLAVEMMK